MSLVSLAPFFLLTCVRALLIRIYLKAYKTKDRSALESIVSEAFTFTSPRDQYINRV